VKDGRIELPEPEPVPGLASDEWSPPPVWLVSRGRILQGSYGEFCKLDDCTGMETPEQMGDDLAAMRVSGKETFVVVGSSRVSGFAAGTREWGGESAGPPVPGVYTEPGVPQGMRGLGVRRIPEGAKPTVDTTPSAISAGTTGPVSDGASSDASGDVSVFELASTSEPGDRRLSVFLEIGEYDRAVYHWRLDPGREGEIASPEASPEATSATIEELTSPGETTAEETTSLVTEDEPDGPAFRNVETRPVGDSPTGVAAGEGHLWVLDRDSSRTALLELDPDTGETLSATKIPATGSGLEAGAGAVWLLEEDMGTVLRLYPSSGKVVRRIRVGGSPSEMAVAEGAVWVAVTDGERSGRVVKIDSRRGGAGGAVAEIQTPGAVQSIAVDAASGDVWAVIPEAHDGEDKDEDWILRIDPRTNEISERLAVPGGVSDVSAGGGAVWATTPGGDLLEILAREARISGVTPLPSPGPYELEFGAGSLWVASVNALTRVDAGGAAKSLKVGPYGAEDLTVGESYVWTVGPGAGRSGKLTRVTP
jgi:hypothetical protein